MHLAFIIYGERRAVEKTLREIEAQKHAFRFKNNDGKDNGKGVWLEGQIRELPFGIKECIFPKEDLDKVLATIGGINTHYLSKFGISILRKVIGYKPIPNFKKEEKFLWQTENTSIIVLGIKEDGLMFDEKIKEWHEAL